MPKRHAFFNENLTAFFHVEEKLKTRRNLNLRGSGRPSTCNI